MSLFVDASTTRPMMCVFAKISNLAYCRHAGCSLLNPVELLCPQLLEASERGVEVILFLSLHPRFRRCEKNDASPLQFVSVRVGALDDHGRHAPVGVERVYLANSIAG